jgi:hypothetical protein
MNLTSDYLFQRVPQQNLSMSHDCFPWEVQASCSWMQPQEPGEEKIAVNNCLTSEWHWILYSERNLQNSS